MYLLLLLLPAVLHSQLTTSALSGQWDEELRIAQLEAAVESLERQVSDLMGTSIRQRSEIYLLRSKTETALALSNSTWTLRRTEIIFANLEKLTLHQVTPTYVEDLPLPLPHNTRALVVQIFCNFWNSDGHAYLDVDISQEGNEEGGVASVENTHFQVYANTFNYEVFVPWDSAISNELRFEVKRSYQTGGENNWYRLRVVGYVLA